MTPRTSRGEPPKDSSDKTTPTPPVEDEEDDGDIATPKRERDYEAEAFKQHDGET